MTYGRLPLESAVEYILAALKPPRETECVPLADALGRVAAETVTARHEQPPFDRSPLDGYAFDHTDAAAATPDAPVRLPVAMTLYAGAAPGRPLARGTAARIFTGAPIPPGATCVVRQEDVVADAGHVLVPTRPVANGNIGFRGEYVASGATLAAAGERLERGRIALLAGDGVARVRVFPRPRVSILSTGDELLEPGVALVPGKVYDSNRQALAARARELGADVAACRTETDSAPRLADALSGLAARCDLVVATGGVSVGERDCMPQAGAKAGARTLFHGIAVKPGSPAMALELGGTVALCLSGNPFAAFVTFELLAAPAIRRLAGLREALGRRVRCRLAEDFAKGGGQRRFVPGRLMGGDVFFGGGGRGDRSLATLVDADCLVDLPPNPTAPAKGTEVEVVLL